jgi:hypothetical protein
VQYCTSTQCDAADIQANGLIETIITYENKILDGRNRFVACQLAEVKPVFSPYTGDSPLTFVISKNIHRRHLTPSQAAVIALDVMPMFESEARKRQSLNALTNQPQNSQKIDYLENSKTGRSTQSAAKLFNTNRQYISDAGRLRESALMVPAAGLEKHSISERGKALPQPPLVIIFTARQKLFLIG